jgi:hypothetical protein
MCIEVVDKIFNVSEGSTSRGLEMNLTRGSVKWQDFILTLV